MFFKAIVTNYLRPRRDGSPYTSTICAGSFEKCLNEAIAHGPGASVHIWAPYGVDHSRGSVVVTGYCGRI